MIAFPPYRLDLHEERLWKGGKLLELRRKPFAILRHLVAHPKRLVTHDELLQHVWAGATVSESSVRSHLHDLRQVLGDGVIETVIGRGYRFVAELAPEVAEPVVRAPVAPRPERVVVGRDPELAILRAAFDRVATGHRQVCVVSGDPGIGKTTIVDAFLDELEDRGVLAVRGHCVEQFGTPEAYLPMIELLGRVRRSERGDQMLAVFSRYAPTFLAKLPHLVPDELHAEVTRRSQGGSEARMMRELAEALEVACAHEPLVIVLEDVQWSDIATIDLLALLGQRAERAKLLVIATSRRAALNTPEHPLARVVKSLVARFGAAHLAVDRIPRDSVGELLARRFGAHALPAKLVDALVLITGGTPLFLVTLLEDLVGRGMIAQRDGQWTLTASLDEVAAHRPDSIKQLIDIQLDRLNADEQRILEVASLVGAVFSTGPVAAALGVSVEHVDDLCDALARRGLFLRREASEETPDGDLLSTYAVTHALVQEVNEERGSPAKRQRWHRSIAEFLEHTYAGHREHIAPAVASHFDKAGLPARAVEYYLIAGDRSARRFASRDALSSYERALALVTKLPRTPERDKRELALLSTIGQMHIRMPFSGDPASVYQRAIDLAREIGDIASLYAGLSNLCIRHMTRGQYDLAAMVCDEIAAIAASHPLDPQVLEYGVNVQALTAAYRGQIAHALGLFERLAESTAASQPDVSVINRSALWGPVVRAAIARSYVALARLLVGEPDRALREARDAVEAALQLDDPISLGVTESMLTRIHYLRRDPVGVIEAAVQTMVRRATAGQVILDEARTLALWAEYQRKPLPADVATRIAETYRARLASVSLGATIAAVPITEMLYQHGYADDARALIAGAIEYALRCHELLLLPELYRMQGDLAASAVDAIAAYREAHDRATTMEMWMFALRAALRLAKHDAAAARPLIAAAVARCAERSDIPDFVEARSVLGIGDEPR